MSPRSWRAVQWVWHAGYRETVRGRTKYQRLASFCAQWPSVPERLKAGLHLDSWAWRPPRVCRDVSAVVAGCPVGLACWVSRNRSGTDEGSTPCIILRTMAVRPRTIKGWLASGQLGLAAAAGVSGCLRGRGGLSSGSGMLGIAKPFGDGRRIDALHHSAHNGRPSPND